MATVFDDSDSTHGNNSQEEKMDKMIDTNNTNERQTNGSISKVVVPNGRENEAKVDEQQQAKRPESQLVDGNWVR